MSDGEVDSFLLKREPVGVFSLPSQVWLSGCLGFEIISYHSWKGEILFVCDLVDE